MQTVQNNFARPGSLYWRVLFWFTLIHLVIVGFMARGIGDFGLISSLHFLHFQELGAVKAVCALLYLTSPIVACALMGGDLAALYFTWRWAHRLSSSRRLVITYLSVAIGLAASHAAGASDAVGDGIFQTTTGVFYITSDIVQPLVMWDAISVLPPLLILAGLIFRGRPRRRPGVCASCGYDLTGNTSGVCPECGTPTAERR